MTADADIKSVVSLLQEMPDWTTFSLNQDHSEQRVTIERIVQKIARYDLDTIRAAMATYYAGSVQEGQLAAPMGRLFILNNYLFDLPESVSGDSPHFRLFGGWWREDVKTDDLTLSLRWPWSVAEDGTWRLTGRFAGYKGPPYDAFAAFDYYRQNFGKRPDAGR